MATIDGNPAAELREAVDGIRGRLWGADHAFMHAVAAVLEDRIRFYAGFPVAVGAGLADGDLVVAAARAFLGTEDGGGLVP